MEHFNKLSPAEAERLAILAEECGEVIQVVGKILRHGFQSTHPDGGPTNRQQLEKEMGALFHVIVMMALCRDVDTHQIIVIHAQEKRRNLARYTHHQEDSSL